MDPEFGIPTPDTTSRERPGAYAIAIVDGRVLVVETPAGLYLPGGGFEPGESAEATLRREVREETGHGVVTARELGTARQHVGSGIAKIESFFAVSLVGRAAPGESDHSPRWLPVEAAIAGMAEEVQAWAIRLAWDAGEEE